MIKEIENLKINYELSGEGDAVLILHGWGSNIELHRHMAEVLSAGYTVIMPDLPGFGGSDEPPEPWSVDDYVDFVLKFLEPYGFKKLTLIGHSFGGRIIIKLCSLQLPFEVDKVILIDSAGVKPEKTKAQILKQKGFKAGKKILSTAPAKLLFPDALDELRSRAGSADYNSATPVMRSTLVKVVNEDLRDLMPNVKCPALLIWGSEDDATPVSDGKIMESLMPESALIVFEGCGHYSFIENRGQFTAVLKSFMNLN